MGPAFDLYLWALLMLRYDMAMLMWRKNPDSPVRSALLAATLYRRWAALPDVKPHVAASMLEHAQEFENVAVEVQLQASKVDAKQALETLEMVSRLWKGQTGVDLAVLGGCSNFLERCCVQALDYRWSGDIHPYNQRFGLYPSVIASILSGGLLVPYCIEFRKPPRAEVLRSPSQKIPILKSYHASAKDSMLSDNTEAYEALFTNLQKATSDQVDCSADYMLQLNHRQVRELTVNQETDASGTELSFRERIRLFFTCPVTIFVMDAIVHLLQNVIFMVFLLETGDPKELTYTEYFMAIIQLSQALTEFVQLQVPPASPLTPPLPCSPPHTHALPLAPPSPPFTLTRAHTHSAALDGPLLHSS